MMDEFTADLAQCAYETLQSRKGKRVELSTLKDGIWQCYTAWRDAIIEAWADTTLGRVPSAHLTARMGVVWDCLAHHGEYWEWPEEQDAAAWTAWGLAVLRWLNQEFQERVPEPQFSHEELSAWLAAKTPIQLSMF